MILQFVQVIADAIDQTKYSVLDISDVAFQSFCSDLGSANACESCFVYVFVNNNFFDDSLYRSCWSLNSGQLSFNFLSKLCLDSV